MKVRDKTLPKSEYDGRLTDASDSICPCLPCYRPHDCGRNWHTGNGKMKWVINMQCITRYNSGCPITGEKRKEEAEHIYVSDKAKVCKRCGQVKVQQLDK